MALLKHDQTTQISAVTNIKMITIYMNTLNPGVITGYYQEIHCLTIVWHQRVLLHWLGFQVCIVTQVASHPIRLSGK